MTLSRRRFLTAASLAAAAGSASMLRFPDFDAANAEETEPTVLRIVNRTIEVNGKAAKVYGLAQPNGAAGLFPPAGQFRVRLESQIELPTLIHWHGLLPPYGQDGVPDLPQPLLAGGRSYDYDFPLKTPGTHWMHAHTLQEQQLLAAPLIVGDPAEAVQDEQQVIVLFHDFSFTPPEELLARLRGTQAPSGMPGHDGMAGMSMADMPGHDMASMTMDVNDIDYDAYLANDRTLDDPEVFRVEPGGIVRLRLINGATATAFWIDLGELRGEATAVDGNSIAPVSGTRFPLAMGQRIDIRIRLPKAQGAWPILAMREGAPERTGFVLATQAGTVRGIATAGDATTGPLDLELEAGLRAAQPLTTRAADRQENLTLGGDMATYAWTLSRAADADQPLAVRAGERIEVTMSNQSMMGHPMHLHGHHFQVVAIDGRRLAGAVRDTVWIPPQRAVTIAFDADNPGTWAFHCHHLYHMASGMMTTATYES
jgi:FtsP/CotA-like multicopper oxidase with cupredoxin domain